jgi:hypothetical protein
VLATTAPDTSGFIPLEGDVPLAPGAQGGFHVWIKYRLMGMSPGVVSVKTTARRKSDDKLILTTERRIEVGSVTPEGFWETPSALPAFMCPSPIGVRVRDEAVTFRVEVYAPNGALLGEKSATATPRCPTDDQAAFCDRICSG